MNSLTIELPELPKVQHVVITDDTLTVDLSDGRTLSVPLAWYPRLLQGSEAERSNYRFIAEGVGIHWEQLDEDISIKNLLLGQPSGESQKSFQRWLSQRPETIDKVQTQSTDTFTLDLGQIAERVDEPENRPDLESHIKLHNDSEKSSLADELDP